MTYSSTSTVRPSFVQLRVFGLQMTTMLYPQDSLDGTDLPASNQKDRHNMDRQGTFGAEDSGEGLVFGEVDEEFSTPVSVTRASSRAADVTSTDGVFYSPETSPPAVDTPAEPAVTDTAVVHTYPTACAAASSADSAGAGEQTHSSSDAQQTEQQQLAVGSDDSSDSEVDAVGHAAPDDAAAKELTLLLSSAALPGDTALPAAGVPPAPDSSASDLAPQLQQSHSATAADTFASSPLHQSGLLSLAELTLSSTSSQQAGSMQQALPPSSPSAATTASSDTGEADDTTGDSAAEAAAGDDAATGPADAAISMSGAADSQWAAGSGLEAQGSSSAAAAAGSASGSSPSSSRQVQPDMHVSPPCSPVAVHGSAGLERAASWQLQHAAAAAAGTAAHPAPPRSDMDLAKLSNTPASPHGESGWAAWQQRRRHFFVLTAAGKPVYSRHGDEQALAGFMAVIQALVSVMSDQGDIIHSISVGSSSLEFLLRGQLYLVAVSSRGEAPCALRRQLELLYQSILMVATGGIERLLTRSPGYDVQQLLAGAKPSMNALISGYGDCPGWMMASVEPAPTAAPDRQLVTAALQEAVRACDCLYGVLLVAGHVVAVERGSSAPPLNVFDLLLLINFSSSNESLRHNETFVPVCLPNFQPNAFVHAYVNCLDEVPQMQQEQQPLEPGLSSQPQQPLTQPGAIQQPPQQQQQQLHGSGSSSSSGGRGTFLMLLSGSADAFHKLSAAQSSFVGSVTAGPGGGVLARVQAAAVQPGRGRVRVEALPAPLGGGVGSTPLWHALIRYPQRHQHITLAYPQQLFSERSQVKQLVRSYCRLYCTAYGQLLEANAMATAAGPFGSGGSSSSSSSTGGAGTSHAATAAAAAGKAHKLLWVTSQRWVTGVLIDRDVEVYVTFDPLTEKDLGLKTAETLKRLFGDKARRQDLLVPGL